MDDGESDMLHRTKRVNAVEHSIDNVNDELQKSLNDSVSNASLCYVMSGIVKIPEAVLLWRFKQPHLRLDN